MAGIADVNGRHVPLRREAVRGEVGGHAAARLPVVRPRDGRRHGPPGCCRPPVAGRRVAPVAVVAAA